MFNTKIEEGYVGDLCCTQYIYPKRKNVMTNVIRREGFKYDENYILVSKDLEIIDGNHRYCALLKLKGPSYQIKVKKVGVSKKLYIFLFLSIVYVSIVIGILSVYFIKNYFFN